MHAHEFPTWRLSERRNANLGVACDADGLVWGRTPLVENNGFSFTVRPQRELERLFAASAIADVNADGRLHRLRAIAAALNKGDLCSATISAVLLQLPDFPDFSTRENVEDEDYLLKIERVSRTNARPANIAKLVSQFDPLKHPRWPRGHADGGEFKPLEGAGANDGVAVHEVSDSDEADRHGIGGNNGPPLEDPPEIPPEQPSTTKGKNAFLRRAAGWLAQASKEGGKNPRAIAFRVALEAAKWLGEEYLPDIVSYLDRPKPLGELQDAVEGASRPGYEKHHIVEAQSDSKNPQANSRLFSSEQLEGRDNVVSIPYWKHREISEWYSRPNEKYGWQTPRDYMRGKSWKEQYDLGLEKLREFGVLKQ